MFSFNNGVLKVDEVDEQFRPLFLLYNSLDPRLADMIAANHFDLDMPDLSEAASYSDIPIPAVMKVASDQGFPSVVSDWLVAMLGRAMFNVREFDMWRKVPWIIGTSNTGKSTLLNYVVKEYYQIHDVGILE